MPTKRDAETLTWSIRVAKAPGATMYDKLSAAEFLVAYGMTDEADAAIHATNVLMSQSGVSTARLMNRLSAINRRFHDARINVRLKNLGSLGTRLLAEEESVLSVAKDSRTLLVVFSSMNGDFWVSYPVLHCLLPTDTTSILYLKDPSEMMYLCGLPSFGATFDSLLAGIRAVARDIGVSDIRVMGFSSGGYPGLLVASRIDASAFLGFSIRTDLDPGSSLPTDRYVARENLRSAAGELLFDLKPVLQKSAAPKLAVLYYGKMTELDAAHAKHLADLPHFVVKELAETRHNTVMTLLADGKFDGVIRKFLA